MEEISDLTVALHELSVIFWRGSLEDICFGRESEFSRNIQNFVTLNGKIGIAAIEIILQEKKFLPNLTAESLLWITDIKRPDILDSRRELLEKALFDTDPVIRGDALTAVHLLNDPYFIPILQKLIEFEKSQWNLPHLLKQVIDCTQRVINDLEREKEKNCGQS